MAQNNNDMNANNGGVRRAGRHARRVSYRGSDDYVVSEVGSPTTTPFEAEADLSGFDRMVIEHAPEEIIVETVGKADPFQADAPENYTRPFTTAFPDGDRAAYADADRTAVAPHGYSSFGRIADADVYTVGSDARSGQTSPQQPLHTESVGRADEAPLDARARQGHAANRADDAFDAPAWANADAAEAVSGKKGRKKGGKKGSKKPHSKLKKVLIAIAVVIICALAAFFIYTHLLDSALDKSEGGSANSALATVSLDEPFYMLVMGGDSATDTASGDGEPTGQRADVIMLVRIDAKNKVLTMVSIPRDTPYTWEDGSVTKINECYYYGGAEGTIRAVSELTGVEISHYVSLSFDDLDEIVDALGGVTVYVDTPIAQKMEGRYVELDAGEQEVNGLEALAFARSRKNYEDNQEAHRQGNVRSLAAAIIDKTLSKPIYELPGTILELAQYVSTDLRSADMFNLAMAFGGSTSGLTVYSGSGPTDGGIMDEYGGYWYCYPNPEGWARLMAVVDAGGDPSTVEY